MSSLADHTPSTTAEQDPHPSCDQGPCCYPASRLPDNCPFFGDRNLNKEDLFDEQLPQTSDNIHPKGGFYPKASLMGIPPEVRVMILGMVLPDQELIRPLAAWDENDLDSEWKEDGGPGTWMYTIHKAERLRHDRTKCNSGILRVNRQLYREGFPILYNRTFEVILCAAGKHFMDRHWGWNHPAGSFKQLCGSWGVWSLGSPPTTGGRHIFAVPCLSHSCDRNSRGHLLCCDTTFPLASARQLRITVWPSARVLHIREAILNFCRDDLQWGKLSPKIVEIYPDNGPTCTDQDNWGAERYCDEWKFQDDECVTHFNDDNTISLAEKLRPLAHVQGFKMAGYNFGLPVVCKEVFDVFDSCIKTMSSKILCDKGCIAAMEWLSATLWNNYTWDPVLQTCNKGEHHDIISAIAH